jgi:hypothetical protein
MVARWRGQERWHPSGSSLNARYITRVSQVRVWLQARGINIYMAYDELKMKNELLQGRQRIPLKWWYESSWNFEIDEQLSWTKNDTRAEGANSCIDPIQVFESPNYHMETRFSNEVDEEILELDHNFRSPTFGLQIFDNIFRLKGP